MSNCILYLIIFKCSVCTMCGITTDNNVELIPYYYYIAIIIIKKFDYK